MNQPPPHATYKKATVNTFVIDSHVNERIKIWNEFVERGFTRSSLLLATTQNNNDNNKKENSTDNKTITDDTLDQVKQHASDCVLSYQTVSVGPMRVSLKLNPSRLPSFCASAFTTSTETSAAGAAPPPPPLISLTSKMHELVEFESDRRMKNAKVQNNSKNNTAPSELIDVPSTIARAIKCLQYAHLSRLIHGRVCSDAFFISAFENPWIPTMCLGELPLGPQYFANLGGEVGKMVEKENSGDSNNNITNKSILQKAAVNQPQASSWWKVLAPEIIRKEVYDTAADVWGIGVLTIQLCMASQGLPASTSWAKLDTKSLADATIVSSVFRSSINSANPNDQVVAVPPAAVSFASLCLKSNPTQRPTLTSLLNHPWLKMNVKNDDTSSMMMKANQEEKDDNIDKVSAPPTMKQDLSSSSSPKQTPPAITTNSTFKGNLDPQKVAEVLAALEKAKQATLAALSNRNNTASNNDKAQSESSSGSDEEDEEEEEDEKSSDDDEEDDDELDASSSSEDVVRDQDSSSSGDDDNDDGK